MKLDSALTGPAKSPDEMASMVNDAIEAERFLILTDSQAWMKGKTQDLDRRPEDMHSKMDGL